VGLRLLGLDLHAGARWLNAALLGGTVVLGILAIRHVTRGSFVAAAFGGFLLATSIDLLTVCSQAGSEPLFLFFGLLGLILVAAHIESPTPRRLLGASAAIALAFLSRDPGVVLVVAGTIGILVFDPRAWRRRARDAGILAGLSALPMIIWMGRNWLSARQPMGSFRVLEVHPLTPAQLRLGLDTVWGWISPGQGLGRGPASIVAHVAGLRWIALVTVVAGSVIAGRRWRRWRAGKTRTEPLLARPLLRLLATFALLYLGFMVVSISFFDATIPLDQRLLSPVFPAAVILAVGAGSRLLEAFYGSEVALGVIGFGCLILGAVYADAAVGDDAVTLVTDRLVLELPRKIRLNTGQANPSYEAELAAIEDHLRAGAVLVYLRRVTWRTALYGSETELEKRLNLRVREAAADGSIYDAAP